MPTPVEPVKLAPSKRPLEHDSAVEFDRPAQKSKSLSGVAVNKDTTRPFDMASGGDENSDPKVDAYDRQIKPLRSRKAAQPEPPHVKELCTTDSFYEFKEALWEVDTTAAKSTKPTASRNPTSMLADDEEHDQDVLNLDLDGQPNDATSNVETHFAHQRITTPQSPAQSANPSPTPKSISAGSRPIADLVGSQALLLPRLLSKFPGSVYLFNTDSRFRAYILSVAKRFRP